MAAIPTQYEMLQELLANKIEECEENIRTIGEALDSGEYEYPSDAFTRARNSQLAWTTLRQALQIAVVSYEHKELLTIEQRRNDGIKAAVTNCLRRSS